MGIEELTMVELFSPDKSHDCPFDARICHACNNNVGPTFCVGPHLSLSMHKNRDILAGVVC